MGKVVLFVQQKGGAGKSMLLTQLAVHFASDGASLVVIDLDPQRSTTTWFAERRKRPASAGSIELHESADWRASGDIRDAARKADWVFVDAPGSADVLGRGAMREADFAVIPCQPAMADVWATAATLEMVAKEKLAHAVVLNRVPPRGRAAEVATATLLQAGAPVLDARIGARIAFADAFMLGAGVTETARGSKAANEIIALAAAVKTALG
ncbi:MAG TPA: ParA family protein [Thermohalobaculum sp.]|nr:ParA family protein [Thermohalobaculum sp.]